MALQSQLDPPASRWAVEEIFPVPADGAERLGAGGSKLANGQLLFEAPVHSVK